MWQRVKNIGHSSYSVVKYGDVFRIKETFTGVLGYYTVAYSQGEWDNVEDALRELALITCEAFYTDSSRNVTF